MLPGLRPSARVLLAFFVVGIVFLLYLRYVMTFGVNVPFWDDFQLLDQARLVHGGQMDWWKLAINKHNEHLIGFAFLVQTLQFLWTGFDYKLQLVTGVLIQGLTFLLLAALLWKSVPEDRRPFWLGISSLILFSLAQYKNLLWAFQTAWFLISLLLAITLACLRQAERLDDTPAGGGGTWFAGAVTAAVLASFTSFQGSIVWLAGAVYLVGCRAYKIDDCWKSVVLRRWVVSAVLAGIVIAYAFIKLGGFEPSSGQFHLRTFADIFIGVHGDFWGNWGVHRLIRFGGIMLAFIGLALAQVWFSKDKAAYALPVSLIAFGMWFVLLISIGRANFGSTVAGDSHYTAYPILTYFGVLSILMRRDESLPKRYPTRWGQFLFMAVIVLAWFFSSYDATVQGLHWRSDHGMSAAQLLDYRNQSDVVLAQDLFGDPAMVRRTADFLEVNRFGAFGDPNAIPESVRGYAIMPKSMEAAIARHPEQEKAIRMAWQVYQMGGDLRNAFNPLSAQFAHDLLAWCTVNAQPGAGHYLSPYLAPFAADFTAIKNSGF